MSEPIRKGAGRVIRPRRRDEDIEIPAVMIGRDEIDESISRIGEDEVPPAATRTRATNGMAVDIDEPMSTIIGETPGPWRDEYTPYVGIEHPEVRIEGEVPRRRQTDHTLRVRDLPRELASAFLPEGSVRDFAFESVLPAMDWMAGQVDRESHNEDLPERGRAVFEGIDDVLDAGYDPEALALGATQGLTANRGDELAAYIDALVHPDEPSFPEYATPRLPFDERYQQRRRRIRNQLAEAEQRAPGSAATGRTAGSLLLGTVLPGPGSNAGLAQQTALSGAVGFGVGELYGTGDADEDLIDTVIEPEYTGDRETHPEGRPERLGSYLGEGLDEAGWGGAIGLAIPPLAAGARRLGRAAVDQFRGVTQPEMPPGRQVADAVTRMQQDVDPFLQEGNRLKPAEIRAAMDAENAALGLPPENAGLPVIGGRARPPTPRPPGGAPQALPPTAAPRPRALPADTMVDDAAALLPDEAGITAVDARPLGAVMRGRGAQMLPDEAVATDVVDMALPQPPATLAAARGGAATAPGRGGAPRVRIQPEEIPTPPGGGAQPQNGGPEARQWLAPRVEAAGQLQRAQEIIGELDAYALDEANVPGGRSAARQAGAQLRALMQRARAAQEVGDRAEMFLALDEIKRTIGRVVRQSTRGQTPDFQLEALAQRAYEQIRVGLEDPRAWGQSAAALQQRVNRAWTDYLGTSDDFRNQFLARAGLRSGSDAFDRQLVANDPAVDDLVRNAQRWQTQHPRSLLRRHTQNTARLGEELQGAYGGPAENVGRLRSDARGIDAVMELEESARLSPATRAAERLEQSGRQGAISSALRWIGGMTDGIPNTPRTAELRAIVEASFGGNAPPTVVERAGALMTDFAEFAARMGSRDGGDLVRAWEAYLRVNPGAVQDLSELREIINRGQAGLDATSRGEEMPADVAAEALDRSPEEYEQMQRDIMERARRFGGQQ